MLKMTSESKINSIFTNVMFLYQNSMILLNSFGFVSNDTINIELVFSRLKRVPNI